MIETPNRSTSGRAVETSRYTRSSSGLGSIALLGMVFLLTPNLAQSECDVGDGSCAPDSCGAANSCQSIEDCAAGSLCLRYDPEGVIACLPSTCGCFEGNWVCTDDCGPQCKEGAPNDLDEDGILDSLDNCLFKANPGQGDPDLDGYGTPCDADFDQDGDVDDDDGDILTSGSCGPVCDLDENGVVGNLGDFAAFGSLMGSPPGPSGLACAGTVPCTAPNAVPALGHASLAGLILILLASVFAVCRRSLAA